MTKPKPTKDNDDYVPDDSEGEEEEVVEAEWDPEYGEVEEKKAVSEEEDVEHDIEQDLEHDLGFEDEEEVEPPTTDLVRDYTIVAPEKRITSDRMSLFECTRILGDRSRHIDNGARPYIDISNYTSSLEIAYNELIQRRTPMSVVRHVGNNRVEIWRVREMTIPKLPPPDKFML